MAKKRTTKKSLPYSSTSKEIIVDVEPLATVNFSMLHNDQNLFQSFVVRRSKSRRVKDIRVVVEFQLGTESYQYRTSFDLDEEYCDLNDSKICVHLVISRNSLRLNTV